MIEKMRRYTIVLYHSDYLPFLKELQNLGMVHIIRSTKEKTESLKQTRNDIEEYIHVSRFMKKWIAPGCNVTRSNETPAQIRRQIETAIQEKDKLKHQFGTLDKEIADLLPWGDFSYETLKILHDRGLNVHLYSCSRTHFKNAWHNQFALRIINEISNTVYFAVLSRASEPVMVDADLYKLPTWTLSELRKQKQEITDKINDIDNYFRNVCFPAVEVFGEEVERLTGDYDFEDASLQAIPEADAHIMLLKGWIPLKMEKHLIDLITEKNLIYFAEDGKLEDNPPILIKLNPFAKIFKPISDMYMLPKYNEFDLTPFFAPFFMMFFGFCSGDSGYGIVLFILGWLLKRKFKEPGMQAFLTLVQALGIGAVIMGFVMGYFFAYELKEIKWLEPAIFIKNTNQIFNFALLLGFIQIIFGKLINAVKHIKQHGFAHGIVYFGIALFLVSIGISGSRILGVNPDYLIWWKNIRIAGTLVAHPGAITPYTKYGVWFSLFLIFFFNSPGKSIFFNIAFGFWEMYEVVTGFFGDLLSYIRLFALGVSGGILGIVVNAMSAQCLSIPLIGPVLWLIFMIFGHSLNIGISSLGAFIHPMRLTFVEFYKNSGFQGPGMEYKPLSSNKQVIK